jgi:RHS repeat-associated protein
LVAVTDPLGHTTSYTYDDFDRATAITDANGGVTAMAYDAAGNLLSLTDPDGNTTAWTYDALNRVSSETNELQATRYFQYDALGQQTRRTDRDGRVTVYAYDALGRMTAEAWYADATDADAACENGTGSNQDDSCPSQFSPATNVIHYEYDAAGRLVSEWDAFSSYSYTYDALDRVVTETVANPDAPVVVFTTGYDPSSPLPPGDGQGERALRTSFSATIAGVADFQRTYQYDALGQMVHIGQSSQTGGNAVAALGIDLQYDASGRLSGLDRYLGTALVATSTWQYDARGNLTSLLHAQGTTTLAEYAWTYDAAGRLTDATSSDGTVHYTYDATGQLTGADYTVGAGQGVAAGLPTEPPPDETYAYDANGNRTTVGQASLLANYITGPNNELLFDGTYRYTYDPEGNRTARFIWTDADADGQVDSGERSQITDYAWDNRNRLVSVTDYATDGGPAVQVVHYSYDTHNRWISRTVDPDGAGTQSADTTYFVYDGNQIVLTFVDPDGPSGSQPVTLASRLLWGPAVDQLLADEQLSPLPPGEGQGEGRLLWPLTDHLNTIRDLAEFDATTGITAIVNHRVFDAYGQLLAETNAAVDCLFAFTGRSFDKATGLQNNWHRWYDVDVARWLSQDPYGFEAGDANVYRYVSNQPLTCTDASGLEQNVKLPDGRWLYGIPGVSRGKPSPRPVASLSVAFVKNQTDRISMGAAIANRLTHTEQIIIPGTKVNWETLTRQLQALNGKYRFNRITFSGHGGPADMAEIELENLQNALDGNDPALYGFLMELRRALSESRSSKVVIRHCSVAGDENQKFIQLLADTLNAPVYACDDKYAVGPYGKEYIARPGEAAPTVINDHGPYEGSWGQWFARFLGLEGKPPKQKEPTVPIMPPPW